MLHDKRAHTSNRQCLNIFQARSFLKVTVIFLWVAANITFLVVTFSYAIEDNVYLFFRRIGDQLVGRSVGQSDSPIVHAFDWGTDR